MTTVGQGRSYPQAGSPMFRSLARRLTAIPDVLVDLLIALALIGCSCLDAVFPSGRLTGEHAITIAISMLPLTLRRRWPAAITVVTGAGLLNNLDFGYKDSFFQTFGLLLAAYTMYSRTPWGRRMWVVSALIFIGLNSSFPIDWHNQGRVNLTDIPYNYLLFLLPVALGYSARTHNAYVAKVEEEQHLRAREAVNQERNRIARELHDVVAHSVSIMVLQATAGSRVAARDPSRAAEALEVIQRTGREALDNLRRVVGVLRRDEEQRADREPQPGLDQLETLVDQVRHAGMPVDLEVSGARRALPGGIELSAYRVVQESLTNVLKHANASHARVAVDFGSDLLSLEIADDGDGSLVTGASGNGLAGMRERIDLYGGDFSAAPMARGFAVKARIPLQPR
ncbi:MAG TPA: sensor histidine kinase [Candidatus Binatia bacterium]|nr:sensor histidine kinase [Candidatus Binatia bacterium]